MPTDLPVLRFPAPSPLWASGRFTLRVRGGRPSASGLVTIRRPYALIGSDTTSDVVLDDPAIGARHVYLHLDRRGLYAVDLASRGGSRIGRAGRLAGWLAPGDAIEFSNRQIRVELVELLVDETDPEEHHEIDLLSDTPTHPLVRVTVIPARDKVPLILHSELVFVGRSPACGVSIDDPSAAPVQWVLVRTHESAYVLNLTGRGTQLNGRPLREPSILSDGDVLSLGSTRLHFQVREANADAGLPATRASSTLATQPRGHAGSSLAAAATIDVPIPSPPAHLLTSENQQQLLAWLLGVVQATQGELLRRQSEFQNDVMQALRRMQSDHASAVRRHLEQVDHLHHQLSALRDDVRQRFTSIEHARPIEPAKPPSRPGPHQPDDGTAAAWLVRRIHQVNEENRAAWRDIKNKKGKN